MLRYEWDEYLYHFFWSIVRLGIIGCSLKAMLRQQAGKTDGLLLRRGSGIGRVMGNVAETITSPGRRDCRDLSSDYICPAGPADPHPAVPTALHHNYITRKPSSCQSFAESRHLVCPARHLTIAAKLYAVKTTSIVKLSTWSEVLNKFSGNFERNCHCPENAESNYI